MGYSLGCSLCFVCVGISVGTRDQTNEGKMGGFKVISVGYSFEPRGLSIAPKTLANFLDRITQLYEQGADHRRIGQYVRNWLRWVRAGVGISVMNVFTVPLFATIVPLHAPSE